MKHLQCKVNKGLHIIQCGIVEWSNAEILGWAPSFPWILSSRDILLPNFPPGKLSSLHFIFLTFASSWIFYSCMHVPILPRLFSTRILFFCQEIVPRLAPPRQVFSWDFLLPETHSLGMFSSLTLFSKVNNSPSSLFSQHFSLLDQNISKT